MLNIVCYQAELFSDLFIAGVLDKIADSIFEGGLNQNWIESLFYRRYLQTIHRKRKQFKVQSTKLGLVDDKLLMYPLLIGLAGVALGGLALVGECVRYQRSTAKWRKISFTGIGLGRFGFRRKKEGLMVIELKGSFSEQNGVVLDA